MLDALKRAVARAANGTVKAKAITLKSTTAMERFKEMVMAHAEKVKAEAVAEVPKEKLAPDWKRTSIHFIEKRSV